MIEPHPKPRDRIAASKWAAGVLADSRRVVFLDTETTGLGAKDEIIQIAILDLHGNELCKTLVAMTKRKTISRDATAVHGIKKKDLDGKPTYAQLARHLESVLNGKRIIAYNAEFDFRMMQQTFSLAGGYKPQPDQWECAMKVYAAFYGELHPYFGDYKWQKLRGSHDAGDDVRKLIGVVRLMATHYESIKADQLKQAEIRGIQARMAGIQVAKASVWFSSRLRAWSYTLQEMLEATGVPAFVWIIITGAVLSLLPLLLFGSLLLTVTLFAVFICMGLYLTFRNLARKDHALQQDAERLKKMESSLAEHQRRLEAKRRP